MVVSDPRNSDSADLLGAWRSLIGKHSAAAQTDDVGRQVIASWAEPHRRYHTLTHLREVLRHIDELAAHAVDTDAVRLAAWYHDVVYTGFSDDEENSAARAELDLANLHIAPTLVDEVARLVRLTSDHKPASGDRNGEALCDADLAILAAAPERYAAYTAAVRAEYAHVPDEQFRLGRSKVLRALLDGPSLYRTPLAHAHWEAGARANLNAELDRLDSATRSPGDLTAAPGTVAG